MESQCKRNGNSHHNENEGKDETMVKKGNGHRNENGDETMVQQPKNKKRKIKEVAIFGNYRNYYGYRVGQGMGEDPRLKLMKKEWFEGKDCLDIGCNSGVLTIAIAKKFCCQSILGVDIDSARVEDAKLNLMKAERRNTGKMPPRASKPVVAERTNDTEHPVIEATSKELGSSGEPYYLYGRALFDIISFEKGNFIWSWHPPHCKCYDTILCLSVTKWIHLNWGDEGLITFFVKIWKLLKPGGILILEPQPWKSYESNRLVSEKSKSNYSDIKIFPKDFQEILLDKIGFRMVENIASSLSDCKSGFERPILAFWK